MDTVIMTYNNFRPHQCTSISPIGDSTIATSINGDQCKNPWKILATPREFSTSYSWLIAQLKHAISEHQALILIENYNGSQFPLQAFFVSENIVYILDMPPISGRNGKLAFPLVLYKNPLTFTFGEMEKKGRNFTTIEVASFLYCLDESTVSSRMLHLDGCFIVLDRFIIAMAFIYLVRIGLTYQDFDLYYILAALLIAHKMEEDLCPGTAFMELFKSSLPSDITDEEKVSQEKKIIDRHTEIMKNLDFRCLVHKKSCQQIIEKCPNHPFWKRWRLGFHCGAVTRSYHEWKVKSLEKVTGFDAAKISGKITAKQLATTNMFNSLAGSSCCVMCLGNHRSSLQLKDRFCKATSQCRHVTELYRMLALSASKLPESVCSDLEKIYIQPKILGLDATEPLDYLGALSKECVIEEILIRGKRFQELYLLPDM